MNTYYRGGYRYSFGGSLTPAVKSLIYINAGFFLLQTFTKDKILFIFGLIPKLVIGELYVWQLFTYQFLHGGLFHILFNMLALWMFGSDLERRWGSGFFMKYYFLCAIWAGISSTAFTPSSMVPIIGASGAVYGILLAYGLLYPDRTILMYFVFPMKMRYFLILIGGIEFFSTISATNAGVAHIAHLGGMIFGYIYLTYFGKGGGNGIFRNMYLKIRYWWIRRKLKVMVGGKADDIDDSDDRPTYYH
ncbi:MAG: rhomboid family intramembrane serine protease [Candidatus Schekmanbacteria bacterium]|nr:rhomboid family intramembrane serine protease [Candidatus Schekmanbacteria bacterium]